jgi:hypothetical protein
MVAIVAQRWLCAAVIVVFGVSTSQILKCFKRWTRLVERDRAVSDEIPERAQMVQDY